jgi:hypothetical protein
VLHSSETDLAAAPEPTLNTARAIFYY